MYSYIIVLTVVVKKKVLILFPLNRRSTQDRSLYMQYARNMNVSTFYVIVLSLVLSKRLNIRKALRLQIR